jgi:hypothetical protein
VGDLVIVVAGILAGGRHGAHRPVVFAVHFFLRRLWMGLVMSIRDARGNETRLICLCRGPFAQHPFNLLGKTRTLV